MNGTKCNLKYGLRSQVEACREWHHYQAKTESSKVDNMLVENGPAVPTGKTQEENKAEIKVKDQKPANRGSDGKEKKDDEEAQFIGCFEVKEKN